MFRSAVTFTARVALSSSEDKRRRVWESRVGVRRILPYLPANRCSSSTHCTTICR